MNITQNSVDQLNSIITISLEKKDYKEAVDKSLEDFRKKANIPGFRKGMVPLSFIKKQYEQAVTFEEINKVISQSLNKYILDNKIELLGQPLPIPKENLDLNQEIIDFGFELGISPQIEIDLVKIELPYYTIEPSEEDIEQSIQNLRKSYAQSIEQETVTEKSILEVSWVEVDDNETTLEGGISSSSKHELEDFKDKNIWLSKKVGDYIFSNAQDTFNDLHKLQDALRISHDEAHQINSKLKITITKIYEQELAEIDNQFLEKVSPKGETPLANVEELRTKIRQEANNHYKTEAETYFSNKVTDWLIENLNIELPNDFLVKFYQQTSKTPITEEEAKKEYNQSINGIKYQLIENKILQANQINIQYDDLLNHSKETMKNTFKMYGIQDIEEEELNKYALQSLQNQDSIKKLNSELIQHKLKEVYLNQVTKIEKKVTVKEFYDILEEEYKQKHQEEQHHQQA